MDGNPYRKKTRNESDILPISDRNITIDGCYEVLGNVGLRYMMEETGLGVHEQRGS